MQGEIGIKKAVELFDGKDKILIVLWDDDRLQVCTKYSCDVSERPVKEEVFYIAEAFYVNIGKYKVRRLI